MITFGVAFFEAKRVGGFGLAAQPGSRCRGSVAWPKVLLLDGPQIIHSPERVMVVQMGCSFEPPASDPNGFDCTVGRPAAVITGGRIGRLDRGIE